MRKVYDIHMHLIPEVDDGAWSMEMAEMMLHMAYSQGIRKIFATPHSSAFLSHPDLVRDNFLRLKERAAFLWPDIEIFHGCEVLLAAGKMEQILDVLDEGQIPTMNKTSYVLSEFHQDVEAGEAETCIAGLRARGWRSIIAHAERYRFVSGDRETLLDMLRNGCLCQVNACSLAEESCDWIRENAQWLLKNRLISFLGSDAHRTFHRPPEVAAGTEYLYASADREYADAVAYRNAERLLCTHGLSQKKGKETG